MEQLFRPALESTDRLVLYFNGWALGPIAVEHLGLPEGHDLLVLWDYRSDDFEFDFSPYREIRLVAWSMGIWAADRFFAAREELRPRVISGTALGGTGYQVDEAVGISEVFFRKTLEGLTEENRVRFDRHMLGGKTYRHLYDEVRLRSTAALYDEFVRPFTEDKDQPHLLPKPSAFGLWTRAFIGEDDRVVPPANQENYWRIQGVPFTHLPKTPHYLLTAFHCWEELWN